MDKRVDKIEAELQKKADKSEINGIYDKLDGIIGRLGDEETERFAIMAQLQRHERWHRQEAEHTGLTLQPDASAAVARSPLSMVSDGASY
ncbi:hypothetical protein [Nocardia gamkensis]|uniref:Uncharacterized protein n=1 Tax=Nocardia gamkensis TaxID=352869 RepID=A0A7X6L0L4_9NOCA|nr:hypothetical protein [Nocardia gamkensis]NKY25518.1 hypothetical protein [Nocardia gamkensis]NQE69723.1 hypothetical protein [Nocardia gamkensis]